MATWRHRPSASAGPTRAGRSPGRALAVVVAVLCTAEPRDARGAWHFTDVTAAAGLAYVHGYSFESQYGEPGIIAGGVAAGDYDRDGWIDLFVVRGDAGPAMLFRNRGDGTFGDVAAAAGVALPAATYSSATFADVDGDGWLDLLVLGIHDLPARLFRNRGDGRFDDVTSSSGIALPGPHSFSASFGDYDRDGDLDLFVSRWSTTFSPPQATGHLWRNDGDGHFADVSQAAGIPIFASRLGLFPPTMDLSFTGNFADVDGDAWPDLLVAADFGASRVLHNRGDGTFDDATDPAVVTDENGMGAAIGDVDEDGDLDWFVSSIWDPNGTAEGNWGVTGNRLYRNAGDGTFADATDAAGVRIGYWGWGSTFADLDDDGHLDLVHVNGWGPRDIPDSSEFHADPARVFVSNGDGTFAETAGALGAADTGLGRGVVALDYDRDGDLDLFYSNNSGLPKLLRNDGAGNGSLAVKLLARGGNREAIGARVFASAGGVAQMRELRAGSNFESQDPAEAHFGLGPAADVDELRVAWPGGTETVLGDVAVGRTVVLNEPRAGDAGCRASAPANDCIPGGALGSRTECFIEWRLQPAPPRDGAGVPIALARCRDGDPACDTDGANGSCRFSLALCVNDSDPRLARCTPSDIARIEVKAPSKVSRKALDRAVHAQLTAAFGAGGELGVTTSSPIVNASRDYCTDAIAVTVPLGESATGRATPNKVKVGLKARAGDGRVDTDLLVLQCVPAA